MDQAKGVFKWNKGKEEHDMCYNFCMPSSLHMSILCKLRPREICHSPSLDSSSFSWNQCLWLYLYLCILLVKKSDKIWVKSDTPKLSNGGKMRKPSKVERLSILWKGEIISASLPFLGIRIPSLCCNADGAVQKALKMQTNKLFSVWWRFVQSASAGQGTELGNPVLSWASWGRHLRQWLSHQLECPYSIVECWDLSLAALSSFLPVCISGGSRWWIKSMNTYRPYRRPR